MYTVTLLDHETVNVGLYNERLIAQRGNNSTALRVLQFQQF